ncbi:hypothetical protein, partial [Sulfitobacter geojensis]
MMRKRKLQLHKSGLSATRLLSVSFSLRLAWMTVFPPRSGVEIYAVAAFSALRAHAAQNQYVRCEPIVLSVRRQSFWNQELLKLRESLAHLFGLI